MFFFYELIETQSSERVLENLIDLILISEVRKPSVAAIVAPSTCFWRRREWINWNHNPDSPLILLSVQRSIKRICQTSQG